MKEHGLAAGVRIVLYDMGDDPAVGDIVVFARVDGVGLVVGGDTLESSPAVDL